MIFDANQYILTGTDKPFRNYLFAGIFLLAISAIGLFMNSQQFYFSYLTSLIFWITVVLGALFFILVINLTGNVWGIVIRRLTEMMTLLVPVLFILFIPVLAGVHDLFHWSHEDAVVTDNLLQHKAPYLNTGFFIIRTVFYFGAWFILARLLYRRSIGQDRTRNGYAVDRMRQISAPGMILFAVTLTFASFDWLMSLDPHWYSTIFGVYIFSGSYLAFNAFMVLFLQVLQKKNILKETITVEHYHDLGKLIFTFTVFWTYIAGAQYFLIWYGNIPEETIWFLHRWEGTWKYASLGLVVLHFIIPFFILLFRSSKRNLRVLSWISILILIAHWLDLFWIITPTLHHHGFHVSWMDLTTFLGIGTLLIAFLIRLMGKHAIVPVGDPRLDDSIRFINP